MRSLRRFNNEDGFTLIELLVVIVIIGILLAIAVPSYLGFKDRANNRAAQANIRAAVPSAEAYYADNSQYTGISVAKLKSIDSGLSSTVVVTNISAGGYCLGSNVGGKTWSLKGPGATQWYKAATNCTGATGTP